MRTHSRSRRRYLPLAPLFLLACGPTGRATESVSSEVLRRRYLAAHLDGQHFSTPFAAEHPPYHLGIAFSILGGGARRGIRPHERGSRLVEGVPLDGFTLTYDMLLGLGGAWVEPG